MATLAASKTDVQIARNVMTATLGQSSSVNRTVYRGSPVFIVTDADGNTERVVEITAIGTHAAEGIALSTTTDIAYTKDQISVALFPFRILTTNVDSGTEPSAVADNRVFLVNSGQWSNADGGGAGHSYGSCVGTESIGGTTYYELNITGRDET